MTAFPETNTTVSIIFPISAGTRANVILLYGDHFYAYCAFDIFQKVDFCLTLYTEEVNFQTFVMV